MKASKHSVHWQFSAIMFFYIGAQLAKQWVYLKTNNFMTYSFPWVGDFNTNLMLLGIGTCLLLTLLSLNYALPLNLMSENNRLSQQLNGALRALKAYDKNPDKAVRERRAALVLERTGDVVIPFRQERKDA